MLKQITKRIVKKNLRNAWWRIYGKFIKNPSIPDSPKHLTFICKGNICRSPFAEHMAKKISQERGLKIVNFGSAGLEVNLPEKSPLDAINTAQLFGINLVDHSSLCLDTFIIENSDMLVTMEVSQTKSLRKQYPNHCHKVFLLPLFEINGFRKKGYQSYNIPDPYGKGADGFQSCYQRLTNALNVMLERIFPTNRLNIQR